MSEPLGQILPSSQFGTLLTKLTAECETILEIGTWRGMGSTLCLANGLVRPTQRMWSVEQDKRRWEEAKRYYKHEDRIRFLRARTLEVLDELPSVIDLVLFDGDDEQTNTEFDALFPRVRKFIALDDTNEQKNKRQVATLSNTPGWVVLAHDPKDRNGWAVFKRL